MEKPTLLIIAREPTEGTHQHAPVQKTSRDFHETFNSVFWFVTGGAVRIPAGSNVLSAEAVGPAVLRRLAFFADQEFLPYLFAPLLLARLWEDPGVRDVVIDYPGVSVERLRCASEMLSTGLEAILLRGHEKPSVLAAVARNLPNERTVTHWADMVNQFSSDPNERGQFDPFIPERMFEYLCDRIGSIRQENEQPLSTGINQLPTGTRITPFIRNVVRQLLPDFPQLLDDPSGSTVSVLNTAWPKLNQDPGNPVTCLMYLIWAARPDLQDAFDLSTPDGKRNLGDWFLARSGIEFQVADEFLAPVRMARETASNSAHYPKQKNAVTVDAPERRGMVGANLVGYPRAEMGMGELLRRSAAALSTTGIPFCILDFECGITASQQDTRYKHVISSDNPYNFNLLHINADQIDLAREKLGAAFFRNHYNIGYWAWELSNFPDEWLYAIDLVDEIWVLSTFMQEAISKKTNKPVIRMPLAVEFPDPAVHRDETRKKFGLPTEAFLFFFSFDFSSFATRKNFEGCIEAFRRAFPESVENVGLVIKTIRHSHQKREFWDLLRAIGREKRIFLIDRVLRQTEIHRLLDACDSFVSLHRSEGFGLGIAEAMYLGKPVIATNYSGNLDFTKPDNSCLVDYTLVSVRPGEYVCADHQVWAEPKIDQAADYMRLLMTDREFGKRLGNTGAEFLRAHHSCEVIGRRYLDRLNQIVRAQALLTSGVEEVKDEKSALTEKKGRLRMFLQSRNRR